MKKTILTVFAIVATVAAFSQSERYTSAMKQNIAMLDSSLSNGKIIDLSHNFERIADAEKTQWLPYYYASYCTIMDALMREDKKQVDVIADKADSLLTKAQELAGSENSEICVIKSMIATAHMTVNPPGRYMKYGKASDNYIAKAKELDSTNPRPVYLQGQNTFYTPKVFGGGKEKAKPFLQKALAMYAKFVPATELSPNWGKSGTQWFLSQCD
jgi:hypothetical protein